MIKSFNEFEEDINEYEEFYGYPLGDTFLFAPYKSDSNFQVVINPKSYWDNEKSCYDQHVDGILINIPEGFGEACESDFEYKNNNLKEAIKKLVDDGFKFNENFQSFIERTSECYGSLDIDGLSVTQYIKKEYPNVIV